ncbi:MAG: hypothetical protein V4649_03935 [Bacteroidota bacterium]
MRYLFSLIAFVLSFNVIAQPPTPLCGDPSIITYADPVSCAATCATVHALVTGETPINTGIAADDIYSGVIPIGFTFNYYGVAYNNCIVGSNGMINFDLALAGTYDPWPIGAPLLGNGSALNCICGPWCDMYPPAGGVITYATSGVAPFRRFTATWCHLPMYNTGICPEEWTTTQIILYEGCDYIDVHVAHKTICTAWNGGYAIIGVQNAAGTQATVAPGRDFPATYNCTNEAWRFTPGGVGYAVNPIPFAPVPNAASPINWYSGGALVGTGATLSCVAIPGSYTAEVAGCDFVSSSTIDVSGGGGGVVKDTICVCIGVTRLLPSWPPGGAWSGGNPAIATISPMPPPGTTTGLAIGTTTYTYTTADGCVYELTIKVVDCCCFDGPVAGDDGTCDDRCYWTLNGNNIVGGANLLGTLSHDDIRIISNNTQRAVVQANGNTGIRQLAPTTTFDVDCMPVMAPSGLRFENLPPGHGNVLVVDPLGYVYVAAGTVASKGTNPEMQEQIDQLKHELEELKAQMKAVNTEADRTGSSLTATPNPSNGHISATYTIGGAYTNAVIKVTDIQGRIIMSRPVTNSTGAAVINLASSVASGELLISLVVDGRVVATQKQVLVK